MTHDEWLEGLEDSTQEEKELDELIDFDGSMLSSKIPNGINKKYKVSRSTSDDVVDTAHQKGNGFGYYYKRFWGEAYVGPAVGDVEEIDFMSCDDCVDHFMDMNYTQIKAIDKCTTDYGKKCKSTEKAASGDSFVIKERNIKKLSEDKMRKVLEVLLDKKSDDSDITDKEIELHSEDDPLYSILTRKFRNLKNTIVDNDLDVDETIDKLRSQERS